LDNATSKRLAKLRTAPVDTSQFLKAVETQIPRTHAHPRHLLLTWLTPLRAAAASLLVLGLIATLVISSSSGPVLASAERLAEIHDEVLTAAGGNHVTRVDSIDAANAALAAEWPGAPLIPKLSEGQVTSCCIHTMGRKKTACVAFEFDGVPVTMAVAEGSAVKLPVGETLDIGGVIYHVQSHGGINMVMTERGGRWVCLMGKLPVSRLAELAGTLRF
jgi:hypothetical protein